jgi:hypothetical protein
MLKINGNTNRPSGGKAGRDQRSFVAEDGTVEPSIRPKKPNFYVPEVGRVES